MMKPIFFVMMLSLVIVACGGRPQTATISTHTPPKDTKKETSTTTKTSNPTLQTQELKENPQIKLPGQFICDAKDSVWYSASKFTKTTIMTDLTDHPQIEIKSDEKALNFKIGRQFIEGEKIDTTLNPECDDKIEHTDKKYEWTYTCRYFITDVDGSRKHAATQASYLRVHSNGVGQLCKVLDQKGSQCWDLSECK